MRIRPLNRINFWLFAMCACCIVELSRAEQPSIKESAPVQPMVLVAPNSQTPQIDGANANVAAEHSELRRSKKSDAIYLSFGTPAPAYLGFSLAHQVNSQTQAIGSFGTYWTGDLSVHSAGAGLRFQLLETNFTPVLGAGINALMFSGEGTLQTLHESSLLISLLLGFDWATESGFRFCGGFSFHVPLRLNYPFIDLGWSF